MAFKFQKMKKRSEKHETLVDVMSCHQDDVVKKLACLTKVWTHPSQTEQLTRRLVFPRVNSACYDEREITSPYGLQIFSYI